MRVIAPDVGGGFGSKIYLYAEETALRVGVEAASTARSSGRRSAREAFLSDAHGRDHVTHAELALRQGRQVPRACACTRRRTWARTCRPSRRASRPSSTRRCSPASTRRRRSTRSDGGRSPTRRRSMPIAARAGPKRPTWSSASCTTAAREMKHRAGRDPPAQLHPHVSRTRRRWRCNTTPATTTRCLDEAMKIADVAGFAARKAEAAKRGKLRGLGYASLHRGLRPRAVERRGRARRARGALRSGRSARASDRQRHRVHRLAQPRPGPRDHVRAGGRGRGSASPIDERRHRARRHRPHAVRHGHLWLALARGRRHGDHEGARQDRRQGQEDRRAPAGSGGGGHRVQGRQVHASPGTDKKQGVRRGGARPPTCRTTIRSTSSSPASNETAFYDPTNFTFPAGTHICEVEIDPDTGVVEGRSASPRATTSATSSIR